MYLTQHYLCASRYTLCASQYTLPHTVHSVCLTVYSMCLIQYTLYASYIILCVPHTIYSVCLTQYTRMCLSGKTSVWPKRTCVSNRRTMTSPTNLSPARLRCVMSLTRYANLCARFQTCDVMILLSVINISRRKICWPLYRCFFFIGMQIQWLHTLIVLIPYTVVFLQIINDSCVK